MTALCSEETAETARAAELARLVDIMAALRTPVTGCPWDLEQTFATIAPYTIEEAYEVADAVQRNDMVDLVDELGDLLLQVVFHARLAEEAGAFALIDVIRAINAKMIRRHPHVFGSEEARSAGMAKGAWNAVKALEKADKLRRKQEAGIEPAHVAGVLAGVTAALPGLTRAVKLQEEAGRVGFDWNDIRAVLAKVREEIDEFEVALDAAQDAREDELGDILFAVANLARHASVDPEAALRRTNAKFVQRFGYIERTLAAQGCNIAETDLDTMEALWQQAKKMEPRS